MVKVKLDNFNIRGKMSKKVYCIASFEAKDGKENELLEILQALEPKTIREDGCIQYIVTKQITHPNATGTSLPIVFNEIWESQEAFELHCNKEYITSFFQNQCVDANGLVKKFNVCARSRQIRRQLRRRRSAKSYRHRRHSA